MLKVGYFADGPWGHNAFEKIINDEDIQIQFICVRSDSTDNKFIEYAEKYKLPLLRHKNINSKEFITQISPFNCDLLISMSFNQIFKQELIDLTPKKIINCHAGKLPAYRGRNILNWALINDEKEFGITVHYINAGIDTGDIILQRSYSITDSDNYSTLLEIAYVECADILYEAICLFKKGDVVGKKQTEISPHGFYCGRRDVGDEVINWQQSSREIFNFIRAICHPGPKATTTDRGYEVKINSSRFIPGLQNYKGTAGQILQKTENGFLVKTLDSYIEILEVECAEKIRVGDRLK